MRGHSNRLQPAGGDGVGVRRYRGSMPLVATIDGARVEAPSATPAEWDAWRRRKPEVLMSCGNRGHLRTSPRGTRHFAHNPGAECAIHTWAETEEHLRLKAIVADVARRLGFDAQLEFPAADRSWIADVLVVGRGRRLAMEVQWSRQSREDFVYRTDRYKAAGLECAWLTGPKNHELEARVVSFDVAPSEQDEFTVTIPAPFGRQRRAEIQNGLERILGGKVRGTQARTINLYLTTKPMKCWADSCGRWMTVWYVSGYRAEARCGGTSQAQTDYLPFLAERFETGVQDLVRGEARGSSLAPFTSFQMRTTGPGGTYVGQLCPSCGAINGDNYVDQAFERNTDTWQLKARVPLNLGGKHLCIDTGRGLCETDPAAAEWTGDRHPARWSGIHPLRGARRTPSASRRGRFG